MGLRARRRAIARTFLVLLPVAAMVGVVVLPTRPASTVATDPLAPAAAPPPTMAFAADFVRDPTWAIMNRPGDATNSEVECYRPGNETITGDGYMTLTAKVDSSCSGYGYTSAMVQWQSYNFRYGTIDVRAKLPGGTTWPSIWLLGSNCQQDTITNAGGSCGWPGIGSEEIDIAEAWTGRTSVNQQIHSVNGNPGCTATTTDVSHNFHVYTVVWSPSGVTWKIDGQVTCTTSYSPATPMFLLMDVALGGVAGPVNDSTLPQTMSVDFVHVTQGASVPSAPTIGTATPGDSSVALSWTTPASDGGSPITGYVVVPLIGYAPQSARIFMNLATTEVITRLTNGTTYRFQVCAINAVGVGPCSQSSTAVTPGP